MQEQKNKGTTHTVKWFFFLFLQACSSQIHQKGLLANWKVSMASPTPKQLTSALGALSIQKRPWTLFNSPWRHSRKHLEERALDGKSNIILVNMFLSHLSLIFVLPPHEAFFILLPMVTISQPLETMCLALWDLIRFSKQLHAVLSTLWDNGRQLWNKLGEMFFFPYSQVCSWFSISLLLIQ